MSHTDTLTRPSTALEPRPSIDPEIDLDTVEACESIWTVPFYEQISEMKTADLVRRSAEFNLREFGVATACYSMDVACQIIALAAAMPLVPRQLSKVITRPLINRLFPECTGRP